MTHKKIIITLFIFATVSGFFWNQKIFNQPIKSDQVIYDGIAQDILAKGTYTYEGKETSAEPVYPLFLVGIYKVFGHNYDAVRIIQILLFAITVCILFSLAKPLIGTKKAFGAGLLTSIYYPLVNQSGLLLQEILFTFLVVSLVYSLYKVQNGQAKWWFLPGIILGLATLTKGSIQFFFFFVIGYIFYIYWKKISFKKICFKALAFVLGFLIIVGPWLARERLLGGGLSVAPRGGGTLLALTEVTERMSQNYTGNFIGFLFGYYFAQKIYPTINPVAFRDSSNTERKIIDLTKQGKSLREIDTILLKKAKDYIVHNPHKYLYMTVLNFINLNSPILTKGPLWQNVTAIHPMFADGRHLEMSELKKTVFALGVRFIWFTLFFFVIYGIWQQRKNLNKLGWILLFIVYLNIFYSLVWSVPRYALPIYPFYFILVAIGLFSAWEKNKNRLPRLLSKIAR